MDAYGFGKSFCFSVLATGHTRTSTVQVHNPKNDRWTKRGPDGRFMDQKADRAPFKGVRKEK